MGKESLRQMEVEVVFNRYFVNEIIFHIRSEDEMPMSQREIKAALFKAWTQYCQEMPDEISKTLN